MIALPLFGLFAETPNPTAILQQVKAFPPHPRLFWGTNTQASVHAKINKDPRLKAAWETVLLTANAQVTEAPVVYRKDGRRLLGRSREALSRMSHLCMAFRLTGDQKHAERAMAEMKAMAAMPDWNPSHFLDTAEMTLAMAIGYDWLHDQLPPELKDESKKAIEEKGLGPYLAPGSKHGWEKGGNNWNQVCHAGMVAGALALAEENPERAANVVARAIAGSPYVMKVYDPDGNYPEGPGYWNYGTTFNVLLISMMESALGTDFGLSQSPGFAKTGDFLLHTMGPTRLPFNFSDCGTGTAFSPAVVWFAAREQRPEIMWFQWELLQKEAAAVKAGRGRPDRVFPLVLLWAQPGQDQQTPPGTAWFAQGQNPLAIFRTSWSDPNAVFLAIKAGTPSASHGHMDIGSFVLDALGERWALDLGAEDYNKLEQRGIGLWSGRQGAQRWSIFRYHNRAHSTLLVNDAEQIVTSKAAILDFSPGPKDGRATVDMTQTYAGQLTKAQRRFSFSSEGRVAVEDDLVGGKEPAKVRWGMVTRAKLEPASAGRAWLVQNGKKLAIEILSPKRAMWESWAANPPPRDYDTPNPGVSVIGFNVEL